MSFSACHCEPRRGVAISKTTLSHYGILFFIIYSILFKNQI